MTEQLSVHIHYVCLLLSLIWLFVSPWTAACWAPLSMGFPKQEYWNRLPLSSSGDLPNPGIKPRSSILQADSLPSEQSGKPYIHYVCVCVCVCVCVYTNFSKFLSEMLEKWITINWDEDDHKSSSFRENFKKSGWYMLSLRSLLNIWVNRLSVHSDTGIRVQQMGVNAPGIQASPLLFPFPVALNNMYMLPKPKTIALVQTVCWLQSHIFNDENIWVATDIVKENSSFLPQI